MERVRRIEFENVEIRSAISMVNEYGDSFFREIAIATVKPIIARIRDVYVKHGRRYPWNAFIAIGMKVYSLARKGYDIDYYRMARDMARKWNIPENVAREIVDAVLAETRKTAERR